MSVLLVMATIDLPLPLKMSWPSFGLSARRHCSRENPNQYQLNHQQLTTHWVTIPVGRLRYFHKAWRNKKYRKLNVKNIITPDLTLMRGEATENGGSGKSGSKTQSCSDYMDNQHAPVYYS